jgi:hypothetical protein
MAWNLSISLFNFGYFLVYVTQIPFKTLKELYHINLNEGLAIAVLNGIMPAGALFGALASSLFI